MYGKSITGYSFAFQMFFPLTIGFFLLCLLHHLIENDSTDFFKKVRAYFKRTQHHDNHNLENDSIAVSTKNMHIFMLVVCSTTFVVYVIALDIAAICYRLSADISYQPCLEFAIPFIIFGYDCLILIGLISTVCIAPKKEWFENEICCIATLLLNCAEGKYYYIGIVPLLCIVVHSYHIIIGFILTPRHAGSILIFYVIVLLFFYLTLKVIKSLSMRTTVCIKTKSKQQ